MPTVQIELPDRVKVLADARSIEAGYPSLDKYIASLIEADEALPLSAELEAELLKGLTGVAREFTSSDWNEKRQQLREGCQPADIR